MNKKLRALCSILLMFLLTSLVHAEVDAPATVYMIKSKESLDTVARKLLPKYKTTYGNRIGDFKKDLVQWNPQITTWDRIPLFSNIYIEYPYPAYVSFPYAKKLTRGTNYNILNSDAETPLGNKKYTMYASYTASAGDFREQLKVQEGNIKSTQNSPLSLGLGSTFLLEKTNRMVSASAYWSSLRASKLKGSATSANELEGRPEVGFNIYYQQLTSWNAVSLYGGLDFEQFSTFNTADYIEGSDLSLNRNSIFYATAGAARTFFYGDLKLLVKTSIAQSIKSSSSTGVSGDEFSGQRFTLFASLKGESQFTYHLLYKRHMLDGPTKLTINRIGVGIGFVIF